MNLMMRSLLFSAAACFALTLAACEKPVESATDVVVALQDRGVQVEKTSALNPNFRYAKVDEGLTLSGDQLQVDILRIEDEKTYELAQQARGLMMAVGEAADTDVLNPPDFYWRKPYIVVSRQEPEAGQIVALLEKILPGGVT